MTLRGSADTGQRDETTITLTEWHIQLIRLSARLVYVSAKRCECVALRHGGETPTVGLAVGASSPSWSLEE